MTTPELPAGPPAGEYALALDDAEVARYLPDPADAAGGCARRRGRRARRWWPPGVATAEDVARWAAAFDRLDAAPTRPTVFAPMFAAVGRRPA